MGLHGLAMPDPYGLAQFTVPLLPRNPTAEQLLESLQLWGVPEEAYPPPGSCEVNYKLELWDGKSMQAFSGRQCFVPKPKTKKTSFSASLHHQNLPLAHRKIQYHDARICQTDGTAIAMQFWHLEKQNCWLGGQHMVLLCIGPIISSCTNSLTSSIHQCFQNLLLA